VETAFGPDKLDSFRYITNDGLVTISKRWDKRGKYLYKLHEKSSEDDFNLSKELEEYEQNLFVKNLECAMCESFEFCKAYLRYEDAEYDCSGFKDMLKIVDENFDIYKVEKEKVA